MLAAGPLWVVQEVGVILQRIPCVTPCMQRAALTHHEPQLWPTSFCQPKPPLEPWSSAGGAVLLGSGVWEGLQAAVPRP